jgi:hypothetical protein
VADQRKAAEYRDINDFRIVYICIQRKEAENYTLLQACIGRPKGPYVDGLPKEDLRWSKSGGLD